MTTEKTVDVELDTMDFDERLMYHSTEKQWTDERAGDDPDPTIREAYFIAKDWSDPRAKDDVDEKIRNEWKRYNRPLAFPHPSKFINVVHRNNATMAEKILDIIEGEPEFHLQAMVDEIKEGKERLDDIVEMEDHLARINSYKAFTQYSLFYCLIEKIISRYDQKDDLLKLK